MRKNYILMLVISLLLSISLFGCGGGGGSSAPPPPFIEALLFSFPTGSAPPVNFPNAMVVVANSSSGASIATATVVMNGVMLTYNADPAHQEYEGNVTIATGAAVTLSVTVGGNTYTASGTQFTTYPTISSPLSGATLNASSVNTVTWTPGAPLTNATYLLGVVDATDPIGSAPYFHGLSTSYNSYIIPAYSITANFTFSNILLVGITTPVAIANAATNSFFVFGGFNYIPITVY